MGDLYNINNDLIPQGIFRQTDPAFDNAPRTPVDEPAYMKSKFAQQAGKFSPKPEIFQDGASGNIVAAFPQGVLPQGAKDPAIQKTFGPIPDETLNVNAGKMSDGRTYISVPSNQMNAPVLDTAMPMLGKLAHLDGPKKVGPSP